jgi:deoxyguanosine kinase
MKYLEAPAAGLQGGTSPEVAGSCSRGGGRRRFSPFLTKNTAGDIEVCFHSRSPSFRAGAKRIEQNMQPSRSIPHSHIVIEGPLGVGKTSLARMLAERLDGEIILEDAEENPFLADFYRNPRKHAFQAQVFFLLRRYQHTAQLGQMDLFNRTHITDYLFDKDRIFARANLDEKEFRLYDQLFRLLKGSLPPPDLVIFLQARTDVLMGRIRKRGRRYERNMGSRYLEEINRSFNEFFFNYDEAPLLVVNASEIDFVNVPDDFEDLVLRIGEMKSGTQYYVPMKSGG